MAATVSLLTAAEITAAPFWPLLHAMIIRSFQQKTYQAFPPHWTRLHRDIHLGANDLIRELGERGRLAIIFASPQEQNPVACGGVVPYHEAWQIACFCVDPTHRGQSLSKRLLECLSEYVLSQGSDKLYSEFVITETGEYWRHLGFETVPGAEHRLEAGFKPEREQGPGLEKDIEFSVGVKTLGAMVE